MRVGFKLILITFLTANVFINAFAEAPVVDDSENYALLEQQSTDETSDYAINTNSEQNFDESEVPLARDNVDQDAIENNSTKNLPTNASEKIKGLNQEIQELRGQLEVQAHEIKILKEQLLAFYKDLDSRIAPHNPINTSQKDTAKPLSIDEDLNQQRPIQASTLMQQTNTLPLQQSASNNISSNTSPADEQISYLAAYELVKNKQFPEALAAMRKFVAKYPKGFYSANAEYWIGELYLAEKNYKDAISHFDVVIQQFPTSSKYSASLLKMGYALADTGKVLEAKERLQEILVKYPDTNTSELAQLKLKEINSSL